MARTIREMSLDTRAARTRLAAHPKPYYRIVEEGLHLGYRKSRGRKGRPSIAGKWVCRQYVGARAYVMETIGPADDFTDADGIVILNFGQAVTAARDIMAKRAKAGVAGPLTVATAMDQYIEFIRTKRKSLGTVQAHDRLHIRPALGDYEIASLSKDLIETWHANLATVGAMVRARKGKTAKPRKIEATDDAIRARRASANRVLTTLKAALNRAWRDGKVPSDSAWRRVEPFESVDAARIRYLTIAEAVRLINAADPAFRRVVQAALQTGARYSEIAALRVQDFNGDVGTVAIRQSKSGQSRQIVLTDEGMAFFAEVVGRRGGMELMFAKPDGTPWRPADQARPMRQACKAASIMPACGIHTLRHSWASLAVMAGVPLLVVARNLGHSDTRMVERHYGHMAESYIVDSIREKAPRFGFEADTKLATIG